MDMRMDSAVAAEREYKKRGFTLTEIAIVLGIIGLILGAIWVAAAAVYTNMRVARSAQELLQITQAIRSLYATSTVTGVGATGDGTAGVMTTNLVPAGVFPTDSLPKGAASSYVNAPWSGGNINVYSNSVTTAATGDAFDVSFESVPPQGCINLLVSSTGSGRDPGMIGAGGKTAGAIGTDIGAAVPGATAAGSWTNLTIGTTNVSAVEAASECGTAATSSVVFRFRLRV